MITRNASGFRNRSAVFGLWLYLFIAGLSVEAQSSWTLRNAPAQGGNLLWSITEGNAGMVAVGDQGKIIHSDDGKAWKISPSGTNVWLVAVTYGNGRYIAVGDNGTILSSTDGKEWSRITRSGTTARLNNVLYAQKHFVAVGEGGTVVVSDTGDVWSPTVSNVNGWLHGLAFGGGYWVATGEAGAVTTSKDGINWTSRNLYLSKNLEAVAFASSVKYTYSDTSYSIDTRFVAVGQDGTARVIYIQDSNYSPGSSYFYVSSGSSNTGTTVRLGSLAVYNKVFVATGDNGTVITAKSEYGPWTKVDVGSNKLLNASGFGRSSLFLAGEGETIYQSEAIFPSRLGNISTRAQVGSGSNVMIAGTIIDGVKSKRVLVRAVGPQLASYGLTGAVADPVLTVYDGRGQVFATNTGWDTNLNPASIADAAKQVGAFELPRGSKDSAMVLTLNPGIYTFMVSSATGKGGVGLVEAYDMDPFDGQGSRTINISTRGVVGTDERIMIAGIIVQGPSSRTLLIRGVGPTLGTNYGVPGTLDDPVIKLLQVDGTVIATNDNWSDKTTIYGQDVTADSIRAASAEVGAFPLAESSKDAALLVTLVPGNYTIQITGKNNSTGVALAEAYELPMTNE